MVLKDSNYNVQYINEAAKIFHRYNHHQGSVLDMTCGTGALSEFLLSDFEYTGIDISGKMLDFAAQRGYKTIHKSIKRALAEIDKQSYYFFFGVHYCVLKMLQE